MTALLLRFWNGHRLPSVLSLALLTIGLVLQPHALVSVLVVAFGGPLIQKMGVFGGSGLSRLRRTDWVGAALLLAVVLLAYSRTPAGLGLLLLTLLPVAWVLVQDRAILSGEDSRDTAMSPVPPLPEASAPAPAVSPPEPTPALATAPQQRLTGAALLARVRESGSLAKSDLVRACGYTSTTRDGKERLNFTAFYEALLEAKGITTYVDDETEPEEDSSPDFSAPAATPAPLAATSPVPQPTAAGRAADTGLTAIATAIGPFATVITDSSTEGPDSDGDVSFEIQGQLTNYGSTDVELLLMKMVVFNGEGLPILDNEESPEDLAGNGESIDFRIGSGYGPASSFRERNAEDAHILLQLTPCSCLFTELPALAIPAPGAIAGVAGPQPIGSDLLLESLSVEVGRPDEDGDIRVEVRALLRNTGSRAVPRLELSGRITDADGREVESSYSQEPLPPNSAIVLEDSYWGVRASRLDGARITVSIKAFQALGRQELAWQVGRLPTLLAPEAGTIVSDGGSRQTFGSGNPASSLPERELEPAQQGPFLLALESATYQEPDEDGDTRFATEFAITNQGEEPIELLLTQLFVLHPAGLVVTSTEEESEDMAAAGETIGMSVSTWGSNVRELGDDPSQAQLLLQVTPCSCDFGELETLTVPAPGSLNAGSSSQELREGLRVESLSVSTQPPDEDGECRVELRVLVRNTSERFIPRCVIESRLLGSSGRELESSSTQEEIPPGSRVLIEDSFWGIRQNRLADAQLRVSLKAFTALGRVVQPIRNLSREDD